MSSPLRVHAGEPLVIDSSVAFKWFDGTEAGADIARDLARRHARDDVALVAPAHLPLEVINVLVSRQAGVGAIERAIEALAQVDLAIAPVDDALLAAAARIADAERIALYDAAFIALAAQLDCELVTADRRQAATTSCRVRLIG
jgi:predicted nucleic acid-binding protein